MLSFFVTVMWIFGLEGQGGSERQILNTHTHNKYKKDNALPLALPVGKCEPQQQPGWMSHRGTLHMDCQSWSMGLRQ